MVDLRLRRFHKVRRRFEANKEHHMPQIIRIKLNVHRRGRLLHPVPLMIRLFQLVMCRLNLASELHAVFEVVKQVQLDRQFWDFAFLWVKTNFNSNNGDK